MIHYHFIIFNSQGTLTPPDTWSHPFGTCICSTCWDQSFSELVVIFPDYALRISLGTFSILPLNDIRNLEQLLWHPNRDFAKLIICKLSLTFAAMWLVSIDHSPLMWQTSRERILIRTPWVVPFWSCNVPINKTCFLILAAILMTFHLEYPSVFPRYCSYYFNILWDRILCWSRLLMHERNDGSEVKNLENAAQDEWPPLSHL